MVRPEGLCRCLWRPPGIPLLPRNRLGATRPAALCHGLGRHAVNTVYPPSIPRERNLDRVVLAISDGMIRVPARSIAGGIVQYLIFELADGDLRSTANAAAHFETAWLLRALHHMATGLTQLHGQQIAHQDLKPSNVLVFDSKIAKVGDLGRAALKGSFPPHEDEPLLCSSSAARLPGRVLRQTLPPDAGRAPLGPRRFFTPSRSARR